MNIERYTNDYEYLSIDFDCGNMVINNFLKSGSALDKNQGITYVFLSDQKDAIIGYYNIEVGRVDRIETVGNNTIYEPMGGSVNINYLGINLTYQKIKIPDTDDMYLSDYLLLDCEKRILRLSKEVGISFITLYSTKEGYHLYHGRNNYEDFEDDMSTFIQESDFECYKLYKYIDDISY